MGSSPAAQSPPRAVPAEPKHPDHHYVQDTAAPVLITGGGGGNVEVDVSKLRSLNLLIPVPSAGADLFLPDLT